MCGRYTHHYTWQEIHDLYDLTSPALNLQPRYNVAPTQTAPIVRPTNNGRELIMARWWLVPSWSKGPDSKFAMFNARSDRVTKSGAYRGPFKSQRCLVPASGWFEWKKEDGGKQPYYITLKEGEIVTFAGLWDHWEGEESITSFTIITTDANEDLKSVHNRMPVVLEKDSFNSWLNCDAGEELLVPAPEGSLTYRRVSRAVNSSRVEGPELIASEQH